MKDNRRSRFLPLSFIIHRNATPCSLLPAPRRQFMSITLTYRGETSLPVEVEGLTPDWAWDKPLAEIEQFEIYHGNQKVPLGEMFALAGDAGDKRFDFEGNLEGVHWIGANMR